VWRSVIVGQVGKVVTCSCVGVREVDGLEEVGMVDGVGVIVGVVTGRRVEVAGGTEGQDLGVEAVVVVDGCSLDSA
jgi:hypothetical protein